MVNWLKKLFQKKKNEEVKVEHNVCSSCVHWKSEELNNVTIPIYTDIRYCDIQKDYTEKNDNCYAFLKEEFEATANSTSTKEVSLDYDLSVEKSEENGTR